MSENKFTTMKNGYNRYEVDDYVKEQSELLEAKKQENEILSKQLAQVSESLSQLQMEYDKLKDNLNTKERYASEMAKIAMKEANIIVETANTNADTIIREALMMARELLVEISRIGKEAKNMKASMRKEIEQLNELLERFEVPAIPNMSLLDDDKR